MQRQIEMTQKLKTVFAQQQAVVLAEVITDAYSELVKTGDFNELKAIVKELAGAQKELVEAQKGSEHRLSRLETVIVELAEAQKETQQEMRTLTKRLGETNSTLGGLGQSVAYALENDAYRALPGLLKEKYGIEVTERFVRTHIRGEEVNLFGRGRRNDQDILIVGEAKSRLDERRKKKRGQKKIFEQLADKVEAVETEYPEVEIVQVIITHYARPKALKQAQNRGIIVAQSFEW